MSGKWIRPGYYEDPVLGRSETASEDSSSWPSGLVTALVIGAVVFLFYANPHILAQLQIILNQIIMQINSAHAR
jgi:hypothetical protein